MKNRISVILFCLLAFSSCKKNIAELNIQSPEIFPDYKEVAIPTNIAPLNFSLNQPFAGYVRMVGGGSTFDFKFNKGKITIPERRWHKLIKNSIGSEINVTVLEKRGNQLLAYLPFNIYVMDNKIDPYIVYRLIDPGYELWNEMGIYQRNLESYKEKALLENKMTDLNCVNCHSFAGNNPDNMSIHMRAIHPGTYIMKDGELEKLALSEDVGVANFVYPSWHPSGKYIAYSTNDTKQGFHINDPDRIEVFDNSSDIVVYDIENYEIITSPLLFSNSSFETFPSFSPDGSSLYFTSSPAVVMPDSFRMVHYDLLRIGFDPSTGKFGNNVDTIFKSNDTCSVSFPRVSPDGNYLLFTLSDYGNFSIWHNEADLKMIDLRTGELLDTDQWNSEETESYHSWSSNSHWVVFSSRRGSGLYTAPYFGYVDDNGKTYKPFLLPQKNVDYYKWIMKSYNVPEFIIYPSKLDSYKISKVAKSVNAVIVNKFRMVREFIEQM